MEILVSIHTYNTYGGHSTLTLVGKYLELGAPDFGEAIETLDIHVYFSGGKISRHLESLSDQYHSYLAELPSTNFYRKKAKFELNFVSDLGSADLVSGYGPPDLTLFTSSVKEVASSLQILKSKLKKSDDFLLEEFFAFLQLKVKEIPSDEETFASLQAEIENEDARKHDSMDEWDKLGIEWEDYHPKSRELLNSPFFWSATDDFSPNGNDTGADVLELYRDWMEENPKVGVTEFLDNLMDDWGIERPFNDDDEFSRTTYEEMVLGLSFAQIKLKGVCEEKIRNLALKAVNDTRYRVKTNHKDWEHYKERLRTLDVIEDKLSEK